MAGRRRPAVRTYERSAGKWSVIWREHGRQREERGFATQDEAEDHADPIRERLRKGLPGVREARTVGQLVAYWYNSYVDTVSVQASTRVGYRIDGARILEHLGEHDAHMGTGTVRTIRNRISELHGARAANKFHSALSSVYRVALEHDPPLVENNPCLGLKRLAEPPQGFIEPIPAHITYLEQTAPTPVALAMLRLASRCALRQSELLGLPWKQFGTKSLRVAQVADPVTRQQRQSLKTKRSERRVPFPASVLEAVNAIRPKPLKVGALMFPAIMDPSRPIPRADFLKRTWRPWRAAAAQAAQDASEPPEVWETLAEIQWKHFRHYAITQWFRNGATIAQVSRWSGDSIATIEKHYAYLMNDDEDDVMARLE